MRRTIFLSLIATLFSLWATPILAQTKAAGLPLPRYVSLRATKVNMRTGPGFQYPVELEYRRQFLPIEIIAEYGTWRKVRDWQGAQGWVHQNMLSGRRTFIVTEEVRTVRRAAASPTAAQRSSRTTWVWSSIFSQPAPLSS